MTKRRLIVYISSLLYALGSFLFSYSQGEFSVREIVEKNIQAAGGKEKLAQVKNYSFKSGLTTYYFSFDGQMKMVTGKDPVITEVIIVDQDKVKRNCFKNITEFSGLQKHTFQVLAELRSGLFTLMKFEGRLRVQGLKRFGPEKHYQLSTSIGDLQVDFYIDEEEFTLRRLVLRGFEPESGRYEVNHDFGPFQDIDGVRIPSSWFRSQVGTRGSTYEISEVKMNETLEKGFFSNIDVNVGEVTASEGFLKGNIVDFRTMRNNLFITTNWTKECIERAGFKTDDRLLLFLEGVEVELVFYASSSELPPRSSFPQGAKIMFLDERQGESHIIYFYATDFSQIVEKLEPLLPIQVKRK
ncbi:MAG: hypothetical protein ACETWK_05415 [Candidatus Aminicenantaceae bacterium]